MTSAQDNDHNNAPSADSVKCNLTTSIIINKFFLKGHLELINFDLFQLEVH